MSCGRRCGKCGGGSGKHRPAIIIGTPLPKGNLANSTTPKALQESRSTVAKGVIAHVLESCSGTDKAKCRRMARIKNFGKL